MMKRHITASDKKTMPPTYLAVVGVSAVNTAFHREQLSHDAVLTNVSWRSPSL